MRTAAVVLIASLGLLAQAPDKTDLAIERGVDWLIASQALDGSWRGYGTKHPTGVTALCVYTLLKCGLPSDHQAVRRGMAFVQASPLERTYAIGATLMACRALDAKHRPKKLVKTLTRRLVATLQQTGWGYPRNSTGENPVYADTSNTQYALLGLRAAAAMGERVAKKTWRDAAEALVRRQGRSGGFGYQRSDRPTGAMTVAGLASLAICEDATRTGPKAKIARQRALDWLEKNWSMKHNVAFPERNKETDRWLLYHLYGVERLGAVLGEPRLAGHDWYAEGVPVVLGLQKKDGTWQQAMREVDTCFALLFLRRGSRLTGLAPRVQVERAAASQSPFVIGMDGEHPVHAWVRKPGADMRRLLDAGNVPVKLTWLVDQQPVSSVKIDDAHPLEKQVLEWRSDRNGRRTISASLEFRSPDGKLAAAPSNELLLKIDDVAPAGSDAIIADLGESLIAPGGATATASSHSQWTRPEHVVDGTHARAWLAAADDAAPWIHIKLDKPVRARRLTLVSARAARQADDHLARPKEIEVSFGGRRRRVTLEDSVSKKHAIELPSRAITEVRIRVLSRYDGKTPSLGFAELELRRR